MNGFRIVVAEVEPGKYLIDTDLNMHPAKVAVILKMLYEQQLVASDDDLDRREIVNRRKEIYDLVTGKKEPPPYEE